MPHAVRRAVRRAARRIVGYESPPIQLMPTLRQLLVDPVAASHVSIGRRSYGDPRIWRFLDATGKWSGGDVRIGSFCSIADEVDLFTGGGHNTAWVTTYPLRVMYDLKGATLDGHPSSRGDVVIGNDVWLGAGCTVMSGVTISDGAVVGAHAVVDRDVRPYAVVVGNRAREVRRRFDDRTVDRLLELKWWDWNDERVVNSINLLSSPPSSLDGLSWPAP